MINNMLTIPNTTSSDGRYSMDIYSRLLDDRVVILFNEINDDTASIVISQLLYLQSKDKNEDIHLYINSPGGSVSAGFAIYDTMKYLSCKVNVYCLGLCASMGAFLLSGGDKRYILPNAEVMIHQPLGGIQGQASDIQITANNILRTKAKLNKMLSENTKQPLEKIEKDTDRDYWMNSKEALDYGIVDEIIEPNKLKF